LTRARFIERPWRIRCEFVSGWILLVVGCAGMPAGNGGGNDNSNGTPPPDNGGMGSVPRVSLSVSNPTPSLGEEVLLRCVVLEGGENGEPVTIDFQPQTLRLAVDQAAGTASFVISEPDLGTELSATCTAANRHGVSPPSNSVRIFPTG
jgi:hypothetical protein